MKLLLQRTHCSDLATVGALYVDGEFECFTLEDARRPNGVKVPGQTCIQAGTYRLAWTFSNRFQRRMFQILNVPMFEGIRIHGGNTVANTEGCILVGGFLNGESLGDSRVALQRLEVTVSPQLIAGNEVLIEILDPEKDIA